MDLEHFVTKSVHPAAPGSCLCLLIDTKWGLLPHSLTERAGRPGKASSPGLQCFAGGWGGSTAPRGVGGGAGRG